jgi:hypothetical protein
LDRSDGSGLQEFPQPSKPVVGVVLNPHPGGHTGPLGHLAHAARLRDGMGQRLLAKHVLLVPQGPNGGGGVVVIGGAHRYRVKGCVLFREHFAVVLVLSGIGEGSEDLFPALPIHITKRNDLCLL